MASFHIYVDAHQFVIVTCSFGLSQLLSTSERIWLILEKD